MLAEAAEWLTQSEYDLDTAEILFASGRYLYAIFMCHLAVEKALKALTVEKTGKTPPKTHNLINLMKLSESVLTDDQRKFVSRLSLAGIVTRYPEELKQAINDYPPSITRHYLDTAKGVIKCLRQQIK